MNKLKVAILVDWGFFRKAARKQLEEFNFTDPEKDCKLIYKVLRSHIQRKYEYLYRIFIYDFPPILKIYNNPINNQAINFSKSQIAEYNREFHNALLKQRKVALRLGEISINNWNIKHDKLREIYRAVKENNSINLTPDDLYLDMRQKGVDMRIGLDIASLVLKKFVDRIILILGDRDFVPAAKFARREGIDFILDNLGRNVHKDLFDHIDGLRNCIKLYNKKSSNK